MASQPVVPEENPFQQAAQRGDDEQPLTEQSFADSTKGVVSAGGRMRLSWLPSEGSAVGLGQRDFRSANALPGYGTVQRRYGSAGAAVRLASRPMSSQICWMNRSDSSR